MKTARKPPYSGHDLSDSAERPLATDMTMLKDENCSAVTAHRSFIPHRPIRVVVFGGGPVFESGMKQFICRLEECPDIVFVGAFCQPGSQTFLTIIGDLWRRRGLLSLPLLLVQIARTIGRFLINPRAELETGRTMTQLSDRIHSVTNIHDAEVLERVRSLAPDLGLIYGSPILKPELFEIPTLGTLGIHHGKAPEYRGKKTTFWAMYNGERTAAVTIQKINAGLDTGEIVKQGEVTIGRRSYRAVCKQLEKLGIELYLQSIIEVKQGTATYTPQVGTKRKLCRDPKFADILRFTCRQLKKRFAYSEPTTVRRTADSSSGVRQGLNGYREKV
jgi:folate-dependent phosphoribosylglycinamide formyltransferase PurN